MCPILRVPARRPLAEAVFFEAAGNGRHVATINLVDENHLCKSIPVLTQLFPKILHN
jgi:hypothetical protein